MEGIGRGIGEFIVMLLIICAIAVPLGIWKLVDIAIWAYQNIHIRVGQ